MVVVVYYRTQSKSAQFLQVHHCNIGRNLCRIGKVRKTYTFLDVIQDFSVLGTLVLGVYPQAAEVG